MNDDLKRARIGRFMQDEVTSALVYDAIRDSFLRDRGQRDVQILAAERLAVDLLRSAWRELSRYSEEDVDKVIQRQVGL